MNNLDHIKMEMEEAATIKDSLPVQKEQLPKEIWVDVKCFPTRDDEAGTYYIDGECQDLPCKKYTRLDPDDIVISCGELMAMRRDLRIRAGRESDVYREGWNDAIDEILENK